MTEGSTLVEIDDRRPYWVVTFSANGEYLFSADDEAIRIWRVADRKEVGTLPACDVRSIAVSRSGRQIAAGTELGRFIVWDTHTHEMVFTHKQSISSIRAVDFSPNSTRLTTGSSNCTVSVWDFTTRRRVLGPLHHPYPVVSTKFSPQGDRIATACTASGSVRIYHSHSGQILVDVAIAVVVYCNIGLSWSNDTQRLFVVSDAKIKQLSTFTGSVVEEWPISDYRKYACIAPSKRGQFIACSSNRTIDFLDASTGTRLCQDIRHNEEIHSIALSPDDRILATSAGNRKITFRSLRDTLPSSYFSDPAIHGGDAFKSWIQGEEHINDGFSLQPVVSHYKQSFEAQSSHNSASLSPSPCASPTDRWTQVLHFVARLGQPFGAFFFTSTRENMTECRKDTMDSMSTTHTQRDASSEHLISDVQKSDML